MFQFYNNLLTVQTVYFRDGALKIQLPPHGSFSSKTINPLLAGPIQSAFLMLEWEQKRTRCGGAEQGVQLVDQLKGKCILH